MSKYPADLYAGCPCFKCDQPLETITFGNGETVQILTRMSLCPVCGDKRCPGAMDHENHKETRNA